MKTVISRASGSLSRKSPNLLAAAGAAGVLSTAYLAARAAYDSRPVLEELEEDADLKTKAQTVWKLYIPAGVSGAFSVVSILASTRIHSRRTAAMAAAYTLSERVFNDYREKVIEQIGERKEEQIRDEVAADRVAATPPQGAVVVDGNEVLCCELHTMRYFRSNVQALKSAQNQINAQINQNLYVTLDDLYDILGLEHTGSSDQFGWDSDKLLEMHTRAILSPDGQPCIAFEYNYLKAL